MSCKSKKDRLNRSVVQISKTKPTASKRTKKPDSPHTEDQVCTRCGKTDSYQISGTWHHYCPGDLAIAWQKDRKTACDGCQANADGVCMVYKAVHPDRDCYVAYVLDHPEIACPDRKFPAVAMKCKTCGAFNYDGKKAPLGCKYCGASVPDPKQPAITDFVAVTALSLLPKHIEVQTKVLESWVAFGLEIHVVTHRRETSDLRLLYDRFPIIWHESSFVTEGEYGRVTPKITSLTDLAIQLDRPVMLINSDIELHGDQRILTNRTRNQTLIAGIRHNYQRHWSDGRREQWGIDAFLIDPEMARSLPRLGFGIGKPVWDYWLPMHFRAIGHRMDFIGEPLFYHKAHAIHWNYDEWNMGAQWLKDYYGDDCLDFPSGIRFRKSLPYPPE